MAVSGAAQISDADALGAAIVRYLADEDGRRRMGAQARLVFERERGAVARNMAAIEAVLSSP